MAYLLKKISNSIYVDQSASRVKCILFWPGPTHRLCGDALPRSSSGRPTPSAHNHHQQVRPASGAGTQLAPGTGRPAATLMVAGTLFRPLPPPLSLGLWAPSSQ